MPTRPRVECLIPTVKVSLSAPPNMHCIVLALSSTATTFMRLTIVLLVVLVRLTEKSCLSRVAGKGCSRAIVTRVFRTGDADEGEMEVPDFIYDLIPKLRELLIVCPLMIIERVKVAPPEATLSNLFVRHTRVDVDET